MQMNLAMVLVAVASGAASAQVSYVGGTYTQNFDTLPGTGSTTLTGRGPHALSAGFGNVSGVEGWLGAQFDGSSANTEFRAQDGSQSGSAGRGILSLGAAGSTDRALGALATSNQISTFGLALLNDSGETLTEFTLSYFGEQWRRGNVSPGNALVFSYGITTTLFDITPANPFTPVLSLGFTSPNTQAAPLEVAINGNDPANRVLVGGTVTGINWAPGSVLVLQWSAQDLEGQDDGLGIDDLSFSAVPTPGAAALLVGGLVMAGRRRR